MLVNFIDRFPWQDVSLFSALEGQLATGERWKREEVSDTAPNARNRKIDYVKIRLMTWIREIQTKSISTGEQLVYEVHQNYLGYITETIHSLPRNIQILVLLQLGIDAADRCPTKINMPLERAATLLFFERRGEARSQVASFNNTPASTV